MSGLTTGRDKVGVVKSNKMKKTIVVRVDRLVQHSRYKRFIRRSKTYKVHDEENTCGIGDTVRIRETSPRSKDKYYKLVEVVERAKVHAG
ncbi:30S ribosomal protein S17 [bacterium]|nr:30S ribosomal protein S17 [bacterium]